MRIVTGGIHYAEMKVKALEEAQLYCFDPIIALTPCYQLKKENLP